MSTTPEFAKQVCARLGRYHPIRSKNMFGGVGIFSEESGNMFAMISSDDIIYMKVDDTNRAVYEQVDALQFHRMPYFQLPESILDDDEGELRDWVLKSADVASRAPAKKKKKKK
jgi:TfoX/Sxy family transcriptional regulator of competence genes